VIPISGTNAGLALRDLVGFPDTMTVNGGGESAEELGRLRSLLDRLCSARLLTDLTPHEVAVFNKVAARERQLLHVEGRSAVADLAQRSPAE
jgi:hypothetical protein